MDKNARILITGGHGLVGWNLFQYLKDCGFNVSHPMRMPLEKCSVAHEMVREHDYVFHCAGFVRGIAGNMVNQAESYRINTLINTNVVAACIEHRVRKIVSMGTVAMYPDDYPSPFLPGQECLIDCRPPHRSEYGYAMAKRGMLAHLEVSGLDWAMPIATNMYGPHDRFDIDHGHCIPSLVRKFYEGPATVWGDGSQRRDFLYVKDAIRALVTIMDHGNGAINLATGITDNIAFVSNVLSDVSGHGYEFDISKPVGQFSRSYDVSRLAALGFKPEYTLEEGLRETYVWYAANEKTARK